jgi:ATP-dependent DNA helicase RecG
VGGIKMAYEEILIDEKRIIQLINIEENYFNDIKSKDIRPAKLSETVSAFANSSGGDIYVGIEDNTKTHIRQWNGFLNIEEANAFIQMLENLAPLTNFYSISFLKHTTLKTYVLQISISKTNDILYATNGTAYIRRNASKLPVDTSQKLERLKLDKGIVQFENEVVSDSSLSDVEDSEIFKIFLNNLIPNIESDKWLAKQKLCKDDNLTVAGCLLFMDEPQVVLPKRSAIKIYRYKTSDNADRDYLDGTPLTIEGSVYAQIYNAVKKTKEIVESIKKLNLVFENIEYPEETLHEIITNAVLHRDYSIATDIQIRIFDNRIEVESPGKLPGYVTINNILEAQSARNPKIVRLINKFPDAPNKDVGEGLNTAFEAMKRLRLKSPIISETDSSVLVIIKHEKLASPEEMVMAFIEEHDEITNKVARDLTGIKSENSMKGIFLKLKDARILEPVPGRKGPAFAWRKKEDKTDSTI